MTVTPLFMVFKCMNSILSDLTLHFPNPLSSFTPRNASHRSTLNVPDLSRSHSTRAKTPPFEKIGKTNIKCISTFYRLTSESFSLIPSLPNDGMGQVY